MTIASDLHATIIALARLATTLAQDGDGHRAVLLTRSLHTLRDCAERAALIEEGVVPRHWLPQPGEAASSVPGVVSLAARKAARVQEARLVEAIQHVVANRHMHESYRQQAITKADTAARAALAKEPRHD